MAIYQKNPCPQSGERWNGMIVRELGGDIAIPRCPDCGKEFNWDYGYPTLSTENACTDKHRRGVIARR